MHGNKKTKYAENCSVTADSIRNLDFQKLKYNDLISRHIVSHLKIGFAKNITRVGSVIQTKLLVNRVFYLLKGSFLSSNTQNL